MRKERIKRAKFFKEKLNTNIINNDKSLIEKLKEYSVLSGIEFNEIEINDKDEFDIKTDFLKLSKYYVLTFNEFRRCFLESNDTHIVSTISRYKEISLQIVSLSQYDHGNIEFGKSEAKKKLIEFIKINYYDIIDFINLVCGVFE